LSIADRWIADWRVPIDGLLTAGWGIAEQGLANGIVEWHSAVLQSALSNLHSAICTQQSAFINSNQQSAFRRSTIGNCQSVDRQSAFGNRQ
jgi:hypothetical protein